MASTPPGRRDRGRPGAGAGAGGHGHAAPRSPSQRLDHGYLGQARWRPPVVAAECSRAARPGYSTVTATEYVDTPDVMDAKVDVLVAMLRRARATVAYVGAGLSTATGIGDYASTAKGSIAAPSARAASVNRLKAVPTHSHRVLTALHAAGHLHQCVNQSHDALMQKAGFPLAALNEIHGAWWDSRRNPVVLMDGRLRRDLTTRLEDWTARADLCLAVGTSLCGMTADMVATTVGERGSAGDPAVQGLVIINLQRTPHDDKAALRIFGKADDVFAMVARKMRLRIGKRTLEQREWRKA